MAIIKDLFVTTTGRCISTEVACGAAAYFVFRQWQKRNRTVPISVNYHFTRKCNKTCGFCFHTEKTSHVSSEEEMKRGLRLLKDEGMR
ncbi:Radical S-adenosyl methionine domain-containing protein 2 [Meristemomyces frigidus]|nr:Radical S-adenosyl methionine domain-containing protein 2 [Meristemomyces frigidus]